VQKVATISILEEQIWTSRVDNHAMLVCKQRHDLGQINHTCGYVISFGHLVPFFRVQARVNDSVCSALRNQTSLTAYHQGHFKVLSDLK